MKKLLYLLLILTVFLTTACKKFLNQQPISDLSADLFWKTPNDALLGNAAIYDGVQNTLSGNYTDWGDARSDNFTYGGTGENQINVTLNGLTASNGAANWNNLYYTIGRANAAIKYLPNITGLSEIDRNNYLAQAYGVRAFMYFYAIRVWGGVPVRLAFYDKINEDPSVPRSPADSILNNIIIPDLNKALTLVNPNATNVYELNAGGILAILTDAYMWRTQADVAGTKAQAPNYQKALETSDKLLKLRNKYDVSASTPAAFKNIFIDPTTTKEAIWTLNWSFLQDGGNGISKIGSGGNTSNYYMDSVALLKFEANRNDIRRSVTYDTTLVLANQRLTQIPKFYPLDASGKVLYPINSQNEAKLPLYRTADILLLRAEALNWTGDKTGAFTIVNKIRGLRKDSLLVAANYPTQRDVEKAILDERQLELFGEGKRWFDLVRTNRAIEIMDPLIRQRQVSLGIFPTGFTDPRNILWPIYTDAINRSHGIVKQNPPY